MTQIYRAVSWAGSRLWRASPRKIRRSLRRRRLMTNCAGFIATTRCNRGSFKGSARRRSPSAASWRRRHPGDDGTDHFQNNLTRRANHRHSFIIARISKARAGKPAAGFFIWGFLNRTAAALRDATSSHALLQRRKRVAVRTFVGISWHARTCRRAAWLGPRPQRPHRDDPPRGSRL